MCSYHLYHNQWVAAIKLWIGDHSSSKEKRQQVRTHTYTQMHSMSDFSSLWNNASLMIIHLFTLQWYCNKCSIQMQLIEWITHSYAHIHYIFSKHDNATNHWDMKLQCKYGHVNSTCSNLLQLKLPSIHLWAPWQNWYAR